MKLSTQQFIVLESIFAGATISLSEAENYYHIIEAMRTAQQLDSKTIEVNFDFEDLQLLHKFILVSDFKVKDINFVIELISLFGLVKLIKPSIKRLRSVFTMSNYKYVGSKELSIIVKGICTTVIPGDRIKKFFLPFFMKQYGEFLQIIDEPITSVDIPTEMIATTPTIENKVEKLEPEIINEESIPTPIVEEEPVVVTKEVKKSYPYMFKGKLIKHGLDVKALLKEELQTLAIELGISSDKKVRELREKINLVLLK
jgi:hypothetical protein